MFSAKLRPNYPQRIYIFSPNNEKYHLKYPQWIDSFKTRIKNMTWDINT